MHGWNHRLQVRPRGHLGHDAAEPRVLVDRRRDLVGEQLHPARVVDRDDADSGLVAGGLDTQHDRARHRGSLRIVWASAPLGV